MTRPAPKTRGRIRRHWWMAAALAGLVAAALIIGGPSSTTPLDPSSTAPDGTKALVLLLRALGADVHAGPVTPPAHGIALVLQDRLNRSDRAALQRWVDDGGGLVITDPTSALAGVAFDESSRDAIIGNVNFEPINPDCALSGLKGVHTIDPAGASLLEAGPGEVGCLAAGHGDFLVARSQGAGTVVALGGPGMWTNANLANDDNSVLAADLLAATPQTDVTVVGASRVGGGSVGLVGLISPRLKEGFWGVVGAFLLIVLWKARRLGRPVRDQVPVELPGSGLVVATGDLLQEGGHRAHAAQLLRADLGRIVGDQLGVEASLHPQELALIAAARTGISADRLAQALGGPPPANDTELIALAQTVESVRSELVSAR